MHNPTHIGDCNTVNKKEIIEGGFQDNPQYLDGVATIGPIRPPPEPPP